jgi:MFS family permease
LETLADNTKEQTDERSSQERFRHFVIIASFQILSGFGSALTSFALGVWAYQTFDSFTVYGLIFFAAYMSVFAAAPVAGNYVDRWDKKKVLLYSSIGSALVTLLIAILIWLETLQIWHIFCLVFINGCLMAFTRPAIIAVIKILIDTADLDRANGIAAAGMGLTSLTAPIVASSIMLNFGITAIFAIDLISFVVGIISLLALRLPMTKLAPPEPVIEGIKFAWRYLKEKSHLLWLIGFYSVLNFFSGIAIVLLQPLVLSLTDAQGLGIVMSIGGVGHVVGAAIMGIWGGPKQKIYAIYFSGLFMSLVMLLTPISTNLWVLALGAFAFSVAIPIFNTANVVIIQLKVETSLLGRVNGLGTIISGFCLPLGYLAGGPIAETIFEPLMASPMESLSFLQDIYGTGKGRGVALLISTSSLILSLIVIAAMTIPKIRNIETELPDED